MKIPPELLTVAKRLGYLATETVFVGGMIRGLLITDPAATGARPTDDVDMIFDVPNYKALADLSETLRGLGFSESTDEGAPICRWVVEGIRADVMPIDPSVLGFTNVWYANAMTYSVVIAGPDGDLRILDAPHFCATKLEAFSARGQGDYVHHDIEDFIAVVDGREELVSELSASPSDLRDFVAAIVSMWLGTEAFLDALPGHLEGDAGSQARLPLLRQRLQAIAALRAAPGPHLPKVPRPATPVPAPMAKPPAFAGPWMRPSDGPPLTAPEWIRVQSSNLSAVRYDGAAQELMVEFHKTGVYLYSGVPETIYRGLMGSYSKGRYLNQWIRNRYSFRRLPG